MNEPTDTMEQADQGEQRTDCLAPSSEPVPVRRSLRRRDVQPVALRRGQARVPMVPG